MKIGLSLPKTKVNLLTCSKFVEIIPQLNIQWYNRTSDTSGVPKKNNQPTRVTHFFDLFTKTLNLT